MLAHNSEIDIERKNVWIALSNLFLDTDVTVFYDNVAKTCANSKFSIDEIYQILKLEVTPVCYPNMLQIAGVWDGFDEEELAMSILEFNKRSRIIKFLRIHSGFFPKNEWNEIEIRIIKIRNVLTNR